MSSAAIATYSEATSRSSSRMASRYAVYCSVISAIGMSVIVTSLTRMRCRRRSNGPAKAGMAIGGSARSAVSSVIGASGNGKRKTENDEEPGPFVSRFPFFVFRPSWLRAQLDGFPHPLHRLLRHDAGSPVSGVKDVAHDVPRGRQEVGPFPSERLEGRVHVRDQVLLA